MQERLPPHSVEAEAGVVGCLLLGGADAMAECAEHFGDGGEEFYDLRHRTVYLVLVKLWGEGKPADSVTVVQALRDGGQLEAAGGVEYVASLPDQVPSAQNLRYYSDIVLDKHRRRKIVSGCSSAAAQALDEGRPVDGVIDEFEETALGIRRAGSIAEVSVKESVSRCIDLMERAWASPGSTLGLPTGFVDLDRMTHGLANGDMIVIAARPSAGKTTLAMNIVGHVAIELGLPVGVFSLEMSADKLFFRMLCGRARVDADRAMEGRLSEPDMKRLAIQSARIAHAPIHIVDRGGLSIGQVRGLARKMKRRHGVKLFVVDYLQLLSATVGRSDGRSVEVAKVSQGVKAMAKELDVPVLVNAQLNRDLERTGRAPRLSDLKESGGIEQDADVVMLLHQAKDPAADVASVVVDVAKQRNGRTGPFELVFFKGHTRFESAARGLEDSR